MRILMLSWEYPPRIVGGISRVVHDLAQTIAKNGDEVHVVTCWEAGAPDFEKDKNVFVHRVHTYEINTGNFVDWVLQLNMALLEYAVKLISETGRFDIVHAHDWIVAFAGKAIKHAYSIPLVATIHATEHGRNNGLHNDTQKYISSVEWWLAYESWSLIVNSNFMKDEVRSIFSVPEDKINIIPNGVELDKFNGMERDFEFRRNYAHDDEKMLFFVGRIVNEKGIHVLIDAVPQILESYENIQVVIAGKGPQLDYLKWKVWNKNISNKVRFTGYISDKDLLKLYKCADIAVFPSIYEPFGIVVLEAIVAGAAVVVSETGGLSGIIEHGVNGLKSPVGNHDALAENILELLRDPQRANELKKTAFDTVCREYKWESIADKTVCVYNRVIEESKEQGWKTPSINEIMNGGK